MQLPGRLRLTTLGDVLGALHREGASGVLELTDERGVKHRVFFGRGMINHIETDLFRGRLGDVLAGQGFLGASALARLARRLLEAPRQRAGEILVEEGLATADLVSAGLRRHLRNNLYALFGLTDAQLTCRVPRPHQGHHAPLSPGEFLHGRPRARPRPRAQQEGARSRRGDERTPLHAERARALAVLGLSPDAGRSEVHQAFRRLASSVHPDRFPAADAAERARLMSRFVELSAAYHSLAG